MPDNIIDLAQVNRFRAAKEARGWFAYLSQLSVTTEALQRFREWRRDPENRQAYEQLERRWDAGWRP